MTDEIPTIDEKAVKPKKKAPPTPNPWLVGATVRVTETGFDKDRLGTIERVSEGSGDTVHTVLVFLRDGRQIEFLSTQLELT